MLLEHEIEAVSDEFLHCRVLLGSKHVQLPRALEQEEVGNLAFVAAVLPTAHGSTLPRRADGLLSVCSRLCRYLFHPDRRDAFEQAGTSCCRTLPLRTGSPAHAAIFRRVLIATGRSLAASFPKWRNIQANSPSIS